jgi:hypothetical protein
MAAMPGSEDDLESPKAKWARITAEMDAERLGEGRSGAGGSGPNWKFFTPLLWAPVFPVIRLALRNRPTARVRAFVAAIALANVHGIWLVNDPGGELFKPRPQQ